jgi:hypothetical protein
MSTTISFDRPVGAATDVKELEYVSFLHQSGTQLRQDGSIRGTVNMAKNNFVFLFLLSLSI